MPSCPSRTSLKHSAGGLTFTLPSIHPPGGLHQSTCRPILQLSSCNHFWALVGLYCVTAATDYKAMSLVNFLDSPMFSLPQSGWAESVADRAGGGPQGGARSGQGAGRASFQVEPPLDPWPERLQQWIILDHTP
jgi:hypothetical protein